MVKLYISGPVSGTEDYEKRFEAAEKRIEKAGYEALNPINVTGFLPSGTRRESYMEACIAMLCMCDGIYMLKGWEDSPGANREYGFALGRDMPAFFAGKALPDPPKMPETEE